eukprot:2264139-Amphidinium_carterae.1
MSKREALRACSASCFNQKAHSRSIQYKSTAENYNPMLHHRCSLPADFTCAILVYIAALSGSELK